MYRACGKQVLCDGEHYADAATPDAAADIVQALNYMETLSVPVDTETYQLPLDHSRHAVRQENDEFACSCGARWEVRDGEEHP